MNKKKMIVKLFIILVILLGVYFEMTAWAPFRVSARNVEIASNEIPPSFDGVSIAVLSDINGNTENLIKAKQKFEKMKPELLIFTGDLFQTTPSEEESAQMKELLSQFDAPQGKFAILSPNDVEATRALLVESGFTIMSNTSIALHNGTQESIIATFYDSNTPANFPKDEGKYTIGFGYDANTFTAISDDKIDLYVGGKTLGGGINLPIYGSLTHDGITKKQSLIDGTQVVVSQGIGTPDPQLRLLSSPELLVISFNGIQDES